MNNRDGGYTKEGLKRLAGIIKRARGDMSYREFEAKLDNKLSHATIRRLEIGEVKIPDLSTLEIVASITGYSARDLMAIASGKGNQVDSFLEAENIHGELNADNILELALSLDNLQLAGLVEALAKTLLERLKNASIEQLGSNSFEKKPEFSRYNGNAPHK